MTVFILATTKVRFIVYGAILANVSILLFMLLALAFGTPPVLTIACALLPILLLLVGTWPLKLFKLNEVSVAGIIIGSLLTYWPIMLTIIVSKIPY